MAAAGDAHAFADGLTEDSASGIEDAGDDGGVGVRDVALQHSGAVHHGDACDGNVVLDGYGFACQWAGIGAFDFAAPVPGVKGVVLGGGAVAGSSRVFDGQSGLRKLVEPFVGGHYWGDEALEGLQVFFGKVETVRLCDVGEGVKGRGLNTHEGLLEF